VNDSGIYLPPSPLEKEATWPKRYLSRPSTDSKGDSGDIEHFSISRESFDSYRRSFVSPPRSALPTGLFLTLVRISAPKAPLSASTRLLGGAWTRRGSLGSNARRWEADDSARNFRPLMKVSKRLVSTRRTRNRLSHHSRSTVSFSNSGQIRPRTGRLWAHHHSHASSRAGKGGRVGKGPSSGPSCGQ